MWKAVGTDMFSIYNNTLLCIVPNKPLLDVDKYLISDQFKQFCRLLNIDKAITSLCQYQSNEQVDEFIRCVKCTIKNTLIRIMMSISLWCRLV